MNSSDSDDCSTIEVAKRLGMAVRSVQLMVDRGELQAWKTPGGHRRISRASVDAWLAARQAAGGDSGADEDRAPSPGGAATDAVRPGAGGRAAMPRRPTRILLIEDSRHYQNLVSLLVRQHFPDVELHVADDGIAGLAMAGRLEPEVMLVDILLPGIDGATLITSLRSHPAFRHSRLIVVTSLDTADRQPYAFALEGVPVVHKPRLVAELPALLQDALTRRDQPRPAAPAPTSPVPA